MVLLFKKEKNLFINCFNEIIFFEKKPLFLQRKFNSNATGDNRK
jgi:hypothetical protein